MTEFHLKLSKEQFKDLLELTYLGNVVANGHRNQCIKKYEDVENLLFSLASQFGIENCADEETPEYPSRVFEEGDIQTLIDEYDDTTQAFVEQVQLLGHC